MFGSQNNSVAALPVVQASDVARISTQLTQVFVTGATSPEIRVFENGVPLPEAALDSLTIDIAIPDAQNPSGVVSAVLSVHKTNAAPNRDLVSSLFPGTVEIIASGRRLIISGSVPGQLEGLWLALGMRDDGTANELSGVKRLSVAVSPGILGGTLTWGDSQIAEEIFPMGE